MSRTSRSMRSRARPALLGGRRARGASRPGVLGGSLAPPARRQGWARRVGLGAGLGAALLAIALGGMLPPAPPTAEEAGGDAGGAAMQEAPLPLAPPSATRPAPLTPNLEAGLQRAGGPATPPVASTSRREAAPRQASPREGAGRTPGPDAAGAGRAREPGTEGEDSPWQEAVVRRGDSLSTIFQRLGLSDRQLFGLLQADRGLARRLRRLLPGQKVEVQADRGGRLLALRYHPDPLHVVEARWTGKGYRVSEQTRPVEHRQAFAAGEIRDSLFLAAQRAGLSDRLTMELAAIFGWDIDFLRDIREGDRFTVLYDQLYLDGEKLRDGEILAAEFVNRGRRYRALRYTDPTGHTDYYTPEGRSLRRAFLRTPVAFTRISSRFSLGRYHPILHRIRAHLGVDYAAPRGTPVKAAGDGRVVFRGWKGGYGRVVILRHGSRYSTLYGHLSRFARGLRRGARVRQGQVIGYVGSSGLATGPHLHYEFRVDGRHRDPLKVHLPPAKPIDPRFRADFLAKTRPLLARLERIAATRLAAADPAP